MVFWIVGDIMSDKRRRCFCLLIVAIVFIFMFILNIKTYFVSDDYVYQFIFTGRYPTVDTKTIGSVFDIFISMTNHWNLWGGRVFNHALLQLLFMFGKIPFDLFNSFMFVLLGILVYKHAVAKKIYKPFLLLTIYASIFILSPQPGSTFIWKSGSANYLWVADFFLLISLIYKRYYETNNTKDDVWRVFFLFILGIIVGCGSENGSFAMIFMLLFYVFIYRKKEVKIPKWSIAGLVGCILGFSFLILAPGNYIRADLMYAKRSLSIASLFERFMEITNFSYEFLMVVTIAVIVSLILLSKKKQNNVINNYGVQIIFIITAIISIYSLVLSPYAPERSWFFAFIFFLTVCFINVVKIDLKKEYLCKGVLCIGFIIIFIGFACYSQAYIDINDSQVHLANEMQKIKEQIDRGESDIVVYDMATHSGRYNAFTENGYLTCNKDSWMNLWIAKYLGINSIVAD